jgi:hypothetical protein
MNSYFLRRRNNQVGKYSESNLQREQLNNKIGSLKNQKVNLTSFTNELKYRIINRLNFNRKSCQRFFTIEIRKNLAEFLKTKYKITNNFKQNNCFDIDFFIYSFRNFYSEFKYWKIAENSFQLRISKKRKKKYFPDSFSQCNFMLSSNYNLSFRFLVKS